VSGKQLHLQSDKTSPPLRQKELEHPQEQSVFIWPPSGQAKEEQVQEQSEFISP